METQIINTQFITNRSNLNCDIEIPKEKKYINLLSYIDMKPRKVYIVKNINSGSYNIIYTISTSENKKVDKKIILRLSKVRESVASIKMELRGIKIQYKLSKKNPNIGLVIDYGRLISRNDNCHQEYSILEKYGVSLKFLLESTNYYENIMVPLTFIKNFLKAINTIHKNNYAHLDLKPSNILLKKLSKNRHTIKELDFALIDFGAVRSFTNDKSKFIKRQMASAAFSPPELIDRKYGKKSDIWAFGVISYLTLLNKFFFKANGLKLFINDDANIIENNIISELGKFRKNLIPAKFKTDKEINNYLGTMNNDYNMDVLRDFFLNVFTINSEKRPDAAKLLRHKLFTLIK
uniref:Protein kinase domain-containing protein n=1 Tax=viral metagenome TaxID=1070528 RepID=A0A6C0B2R6_9ZZZZ